MANTSYLRYTVEPWVRNRLAERYGQAFAARVLRLAPGGTHEFDAVSQDGRVVASIKASSGLTSGGNHPTGKVATCLNEVYYLTLVAAEERLLVLTNPDFHAIFTRTTAGQIAAGIMVELFALPENMQRTVDGVTQLASKEMSREAIAAASALMAEEGAERGEDVPLSRSAADADSWGRLPSEICAASASRTETDLGAPVLSAGRSAGSLTRARTVRRDAPLKRR